MNNNKDKRINTLSKAAESRKLKAYNLANKAINDLQKEGKSISFSSVAMKAGVSKSYLYKNPEFKSKINQIRNNCATSKKRHLSSVSENSKNRIIANLKIRIQELEEELAETKKANETFVGRNFELEDLSDTVERFREQNQHLSLEIERLADENSELRNKLASSSLKSKNKENKTKRTAVPIPDSIKRELDDLNIKINSTLKKAIIANPSEVVLESIASLKYALNKNKIENPSGFLLRAINKRWKEPEINKLQRQVKDKSVIKNEFPEGFEDFFIKAIELDFIVNESPLELPKNIKGDFLVKVKNKKDSGLPYHLVSWKEAKRLMELNS